MAGLRVGQAFGVLLLPGFGVTEFSLTRKFTSETHCLAEKLKRNAKQQGERVLLDAHGLRW